MMPLALFVFLLMAAGALGAQVAPRALPSDISLLRLAEEARQAGFTPTNPLRARIISSDGRILTTRGDIAWLADSTSKDASVFTVVLNQGQAALAIQNLGNACLTALKREPAFPLVFRQCSSPTLFLFPVPDDSTVRGERGFWLLTELGPVGPTAISPILVAPSPAPIWFRLVVH